MNFDGKRIYLDPEPVVDRQAAFEVVMIGHCPGAASKDVLFNHQSMTREMAAMGYAEQLDALKKSSEKSDPLYNLPIPIYSLAEFLQLFSQEKSAAQENPATLYRSRLAGSQLWLPAAVEDFFRYSGSHVFKKLWVINVDQALAQQAFLPDEQNTTMDLRPDNAFIRALGLPRVGLMVMPDLERLQIPAHIEGVPHLRIANPVPQFLPCSTNLEDGVRERRNSEEMQQPPAPRNFGELMRQMLAAISRFRPDLRMLISLPLDRELLGELPQESRSALADINTLQKSQFAESLHRVQIIYPYVRDHRYRLMSASGLLAGKMAETVASKGAWRSVAGTPLAGSYEPFPRLSQQHIEVLRNDKSIGVLRSRLQKTELDDERLSGGVFGDQTEHARSGEISRFLGWLYRELEHMGHQLLFNVDPADPKPLIVLQDFFNRLHQLGALRGKTAEQAFSIQRLLSENDPSILIFIIDIAPAFPIDTIRLRLQQDRLELSRG